MPTKHLNWRVKLLKLRPRSMTLLTKIEKLAKLLKLFTMKMKILEAISTIFITQQSILPTLLKKFTPSEENLRILREISVMLSLKSHQPRINFLVKIVKLTKSKKRSDSLQPMVTMLLLLQFLSTNRWLARHLDLYTAKALMKRKIMWSRFLSMKASYTTLRRISWRWWVKTNLSLKTQSPLTFSQPLQCTRWARIDLIDDVNIKL
jgi:hypothetical protein